MARLTAEDMLDRLLPGVRTSSGVDAEQFDRVIAHQRPYLLNTIQESGILEYLESLESSPPDAPASIEPGELNVDFGLNELTTQLQHWTRVPGSPTRWFYPKAPGDHVTVEADPRNERLWILGGKSQTDLRAHATVRTLERLTPENWILLLEQVGDVASRLPATGDAFWRPVLAEVNRVGLWESTSANSNAGLSKVGPLGPPELQLAFARAYVTPSVATESYLVDDEDEDSYERLLPAIVEEAKAQFKAWRASTSAEPGLGVREFIEAAEIDLVEKWIDEAWNLWISDVDGIEYTGRASERYFGEDNKITLLLDGQQLVTVPARRDAAGVAVKGLTAAQLENAIIFPHESRADVTRQARWIERLRRSLHAMPPVLENARRDLVFAIGDLDDQDNQCRGFEREQAIQAVLDGAHDFDVARCLVKRGRSNVDFVRAVRELAARIRAHVMHCVEGQRELFAYRARRLPAALLRKLERDDG